MLSLLHEQNKKTWLDLDVIFLSLPVHVCAYIGFIHVCVYVHIHDWYGLIHLYFYHVYDICANGSLVAGMLKYIHCIMY